MRIVGLALALALSLALGGTACGGKQAEVKEPTVSLDDRLGQKPAIEIVVDKFLGHVVADSRINASFAHLDADGVARLRGHLIDQICQATGGPCTYTGKSMKESHAGMGLNDGHFDAMVEDLARALEEAGVKEADKEELLGALGGMRGDIVEQ